jgi:hypothetical protein
MEAVSNHESGSTRISPVVVAVVASATIVGLIGLGTLTGMLPNKRMPMRDEVPLPSGESKSSQPGPCALCGTIESIRTVEVLDEASGTPAAAMPRSGVDTNARKRLVFRVTLRMDDGSFRAISLSSPPAFAVGDKVRVVAGRLVRS